MLIKLFKIVALLFLVLVILFAALFLRPDLSKEDLAQYFGEPSQFMTLPDGAVAHYRDQGNPNGPVIVLVHGGLDSLFTWEEWVKHLGQTYRVITVDMPGHGLTGRIPGDHYSRGNIVAFLHQVLAQLGVERFTIGGNSMGGGISLRYALDHPEQIEALVLIDAGGLAGWQQTPPGIPDPLPVIGRYVVPLISSYWIEEELSKFFVWDDSLVTEEWVRQTADINRYEGNRYANYLMYTPRGEGDFGQYYEDAGPEDMELRLSEIQAPTLVMWGREDEAVPVEWAHRFHQGLPNSELLIYDNIGHMPMAENPQQSAEDLMAFLQARGLPAAEAASE